MQLTWAVRSTDFKSFMALAPSFSELVDNWGVEDKLARLSLLDLIARVKPEWLDDIYKHFVKTLLHDSMLLEGDRDKSTLYLAASCNQLDEVETILAACTDEERQIKLDKSTIHGYTPLHAAAASNHVDIVDALIAAGADIEKVTERDHSERYCQMLCSELGSAI